MTDGSRRRVMFAVALIALAWAFATSLSGTANAAVQIDHRGQPFSCPDPSIADVPQFSSSGGRYIEACTTDMQRNAYSLYRSNDLVRGWRSIGFVFPKRHQPRWAKPSTGRLAGGRYWSPELHWIDNRWVLYFAAKPKRRVIPSGPAFAIGVAWSRSLQGPWNSKILHWRGQFNASGATKETYGSSIDPTEAQDPQTRKRYLYWAIQHTSIWGAELSPNGLTLARDVRQVLWANPRYDCNGSSRHCCVEGPAAFFENVGGREWAYLLYSSGSTWRGTYRMWAAATAARNPLAVHRRLGTAPILRSGDGWWGPGGGSAPVMSADRRSLWIPYHASRTRRNRRYVSRLRMALIGRVTWVPAPTGARSNSSAALPPRPTVHNGHPG